MTATGLQASSVGSATRTAVTIQTQPRSTLRQPKFRLAVADCALVPSAWGCRRWRRSGRGGAFALAGSASFGGSFAACCPAVQAFAHTRRIHWHSGGFQFCRQLLATPAFALQCQYPFAQRFQQVNGGLPVFRRLMLCQLFQFFIQRWIIQLHGDLSVINAFAHNVFPVPFIADDSASCGSSRMAVADLSTGNLTVLSCSRRRRFIRLRLARRLVFRRAWRRAAKRVGFRQRAHWREAG